MIRALLARTGIGMLLATAAFAAGTGLTLPQVTMANTTTPVNICGIVSSYTAATATTSGVLMIQGESVAIAPGTTITGDTLLTAGANVCLTGQSGPTGLVSGTITSPTGTSTTTTTPGATTGPNGNTAGTAVTLCGTVTAYTAATTTAAGTITISGTTFPILVNTTLTGTAPTVGQQVCFVGKSAQGSIFAGGFSAYGGVPLAATPFDPTNARHFRPGVAWAE